MNHKPKLRSLGTALSTCAITLMALAIPTQAFSQITVPKPIAIGAATGPENPVGLACEIILVGYAACTVANRISNLCIAPVVDGVVTWCLTDDDPWTGRIIEPDDADGNVEIDVTIDPDGRVKEYPKLWATVVPRSYDDCRDNLNSCLQNSENNLKSCLYSAGNDTSTPNFKEIQKCYDAERLSRGECGKKYADCIKSFPPPPPAHLEDTKLDLPVIEAKPDEK